MGDLPDPAACPACGVLLRDGPGALTCPACGHEEPYPAITYPHDDSPGVHGG